MLYYILICLFACFQNIVCQCQNGWIHNSTSCYYFSDNTKSWDTSSASCQAHHSELAIIETMEENMFIYSITTKLGGFFWLDGTDEFSEGQWEWASTGDSLDYSNWFPGEPNNSNGQEDCLLTGGVYNTFWNDSPCSNQIKYICEKKMENPVVG
ncbi:perlucin-like protein [Mytilus californianus]|uniref:perlucin-like protein n=1 Tax=Mytilus californianus TaxID=6549 RepID=UPI0022455D23|nr:perlucin-like protein [Mytilus californianus]